MRVTNIDLLLSAGAVVAAAGLVGIVVWFAGGY